MSDVLGEMPIVFGFHVPTGELRHVDDVQNGKACNCVCPDPYCGQALIAKNGGTKVIHHFAHERGSCSWAIEYVISLLAEQAITSLGRVTFPALSYYDELMHADVVHADALTIPIAHVELRIVSGRQAPDVMLTWRGKSGAERTFAVVFQLLHRVTDEQVSKLANVTEGVVLVDLRADLRRAIREQGKHADRNAIIMSYQDAGYISKVLSKPRSNIRSWVYNATAERLHEQNLKRKEEADAELRKQRAAEDRRHREQADRLRKEREERARKAQAEREAREADYARMFKRAEQRRLEEERQQAEELRRQEGMRPEHDQEYVAEMSVLVEQQDKPATDQFGRRWVKCKDCGKVAPDREFSMFGGRGSMNLGICSECMRKKR